MTYIFIFITHLFIILLVPHNLFLELYFFNCIVLYVYIWTTCPK